MEKGEGEQIDEQVYKNLQKMTVNEEDVNILLLGETGVGKSTFINSFANYLEYEKFQVAEEDKVRCLIPAKFTVTNDNFEEKIVQIGKDDNENDSIAQSATLETRSYLFPVSKQGISRIRLIDTPGIGDTRGIDQDNENLENILSYISYLDNLHAICFLLKPNNSRLTVMFHYCIKQLLSRLEKSASNNIIFLFTNTRGTFYKPGDTTTALKTILTDVKNKPPFADIKFTKDNVFCLDNESFRYLVATKNGIQLGNKQSFVDSWDHSVTECWRLLHFITGQTKSSIKMVPHKVKDTMSVNDARRTVIQLSQPLAEIAEHINDNIRVLEQHNQNLHKDNLSIVDLKKNLYIPVINLRCKELSQPVTVCTAAKCIKIYTVSGIKKCHYEQRCHNPCYLQNVPKEIIGSPELVNCAAMSNRQCKECRCDFTAHMHIYYESETYDDKIDDKSVQAQIQTREAAVKETQKLIAKVEARKLSYEKEKDTIITTLAKFAHFLQRNAIAPYNDSYKGYIEYLIDREKSLGDDCDFVVIKYMNELLLRYDEERKILDEAITTNNDCSVTATDVFDSIQTLYNLPHTGAQIKQLQMHMAKNQDNEHGNTEVVLGEGNRQARQRKANQQKNPQQLNNKSKKNKNTGINQKGLPPMKAKDRRPNNNPGPNNFHNPNMHQRNVYNQPRYGHGNFHNQYDPSRNMRHPQQFGAVRPPSFMHPPGAYPENFGNAPFNNHGNPPPLMNMQLPAHQPNPHEMFNYRHQFPNSFQYQTNPNFSNYGPFGSVGPNNLPPNNTCGANDTNFDEWLKSVTRESGINATQKNAKNEGYNRQYNDLHKEEESSEGESSGLSDSKISNESDDDEDFKEFMTVHNLEYLVKKPSNTDRNTNTSLNNQEKDQKRKNKSRGKNYQKRNDSEDTKNDNKTKQKSGFLNKLWPL